jgi:hypothetical protein
MGKQLNSVCCRCGVKFYARWIGGFHYEHVLYCDTCGREKSISYVKLGESILKYVQGLERLDSHTSTNKWIHNYSLKGISNKEFEYAVEKASGKCACGGQYSLNANPCCPECGSTSVRQSGRKLSIKNVLEVLELREKEATGGPQNLELLQVWTNALVEEVGLAIVKKNKSHFREEWLDLQKQ